MEKKSFKEKSKNLWNKIGNSTLSLMKRTFRGHDKELSIFEEEAVRSPMRSVAHNFKKNKVAMFSLFVFLLMFILAFIVSLSFPIDYNFTDSSQINISPGSKLMSVPKDLKNNVQDISVGSHFSVGLDNNNNVYVWGQKLSNLCEKTSVLTKNTACGINAIKDLKANKISAGVNHIIIEKTDGSLYSWGYVVNGIAFKTYDIPMPVVNNAKLNNGVKQILAGNQFNVVVTKDGKLYIWGNTNLIEISQNDLTPLFNEDDSSEYLGPVEKVFLARDNIIVLLKNGQLTSVGKKESPLAMIPEGLSNVKDIVVAKSAALALKEDNTLISWGDNAFIPENIKDEKVKQITSTSISFNAVLENDSTVSWGNTDIYNVLNVPQTLKKSNSTIKLYSGYYQNYAITSKDKLATWGLKGYLLGSDYLGRDLLSRLLHGGKVTLTVGFFAVLISTVIGVIIGGLSGFYGGVVDNVLMRFAEIVGAIPFLPIAMTLSVIIGSKLSPTQRIILIMFILGILSWSGLARLVRAQILAEREKEFVVAAKALGIKEKAIIFKHILPNVITVIIVNATLGYAASLLTESALSFLGFGVVPPIPTWGNMLTGSQSSDVIQFYWWRWVFPSIALCITTISINLIGDGIRDAVDPRSNER